MLTYISYLSYTLLMMIATSNVSTIIQMVHSFSINQSFTNTQTNRLTATTKALRQHQHQHQHRPYHHIRSQLLVHAADQERIHDSTSSTSSNTSYQKNNQDHHDESFLTNLLSRFQGDFDNYKQVYQDRQNGMLPKKGGGHEHFHVTLLPLNTNILPMELFETGSKDSNMSDDDGNSDSHQTKRKGAVLASYYFNGIPSKIFRLRLYTLIENDIGVDMKLYTLNPKLEGLLRQNSGKGSSSLTSWIELIQNHSHQCDDEGKHDTDLNNFCTELKRCDILWTKLPDPIRHSYFDGNTQNGNEENRRVQEVDPSNAFHAIMVNDHDIGGVLLDSQMIPGLELRIQDELSLWEDELWVNDRGHNAETGAMVYGNYLGVPYKMKRVASLQAKDNGFCREIVDPSLGWTLGSQYRTEEEYELKMKDVEMNNDKSS